MPWPKGKPRKPVKQAPQEDASKAIPAQMRRRRFPTMEAALAAKEHVVIHNQLGVRRNVIRRSKFLPTPG